MIRKKKMKRELQDALVVFFFVLFVAAIAYPVIVPSGTLLAVPADKMHLTIDETDKEKNPPQSDEDEISTPIFKEN